MKLSSFLESNRATVEWLLDDEDPAVRLYVLTRLLGKPERGKEAVAARGELARSGAAAEILRLQGRSGAWGEAGELYTDKYGGSSWQLLILAELGASLGAGNGEAAIRRACEFILANSQDPESGGFSVHPSAKTGGGRRGDVIPCLTGNMAYSLIRLGLGEDPRVERAIDWICAYQRADDGEGSPPGGWPYDRYTMCFGAHSCHMGVVKSLKALAALPPERRSEKARAKIAELVEYLLIHRVYKKSHEPSAVSKPGWLKFGFPLMYQTDVLEILCLLTELGVRDSRMAEAVELVASKRGPDGKWKLQNSFNGKTLVDIEKKGAPSRWITARALYVLDAWEKRPGARSGR